MTKLHAPDGGIFNHALCQEGTGDTCMSEEDVTCSDCLDELDEADYDLADRLERRGFKFIKSRTS